MKYFIGLTSKSPYLISHQPTVPIPYKPLEICLTSKENILHVIPILTRWAICVSSTTETDFGRIHMEEFYDVDENHVDYRSNVDTSRPFRSVKEAVAVFGERFLVGEIYSSKKPFSFPEKETPFFSPSQKVDKESWSRHSSPSYGQNMTLSDTVKKLKAELEETKAELKLLKEKEFDTEVALATLNAELHESMSKLAQVDLVASSSTPVRGVGDVTTRDDQEEKREKRTSSQSLRQILNVGQNEGLFWGKKKGKKVVKKKPIIPLVGGLFSGKKGTSTSMYSSLHSSSHLHWK